MRRTYNLFIAAVLAACALLAGCVPRPLHDPAKETGEPPAVRAVRNVIDEGNALLTAVNRTIQANVSGRVWTKAQAQPYLDESQALGKRLDQAREGLRLGNIDDAKTKADAVKVLITTLHAMVAAAGRKETP